MSAAVLPNKDLEKIINELFNFLAETGVKFDKHDKAYDLLTAAGCEITLEGFVKFPRNVIEECLSSLPKSFKWWNRPGTEFLEYGSGTTYFIADAKAPNYLDPINGEKKPTDSNAAALMVKLVDAMPEMDICGTPLTSDNFIADNALTVLNTIKPAFLTSGDKIEVLQASIDMGSVVRGCIEELKNKPYFGTLISPEILHYPKLVIEQIELCTKYNVPIFFGPMAIGGISSPVTIAGTILVCLASTLPGITLSQLFKKGHPCVEHSFPTFMDPATAGVGGIPENSMADMGRSEICRKLELPLSQQTGFPTATPVFNQDCIAEMTWDFARLATWDFDSFFAAGCVEAGVSFSPQAMVYANELASAARRTWEGIPVDEEHLAIDKIKNVQSGMFIMDEHTAEHSRSGLWRGKYIRPLRGAPKGKDLAGRIEDHLKKIVETHEVEALSEEQLNAMNKIVDESK